MKRRNARLRKHYAYWRRMKKHHRHTVAPPSTLRLLFPAHSKYVLQLRSVRRG